MNQVSYAFAQAEAMTPFRELLASKKRTFYWDEELSRVFEQSKHEIIAREGIRTFVPSRRTAQLVSQRTGHRRGSVSHSHRSIAIVKVPLTRTAEEDTGN